jgi:hypothetical protein
MTIGNAAIHAAGGLERDLGLARRDHELAVMLDAVGRGLISPVRAFDLEKARDLAHYALQSHSARGLAPLTTNPLCAIIET